MTSVQRTKWENFPDVVIHAPESLVKKHMAYMAAKAGDADAAFALVQDTISTQAVAFLKAMVSGHAPLLVSAHAFEKAGVNAIPEALADELGRQMGLVADASIVQVNVVGHTGAGGYERLARPASFDGDIVVGAEYLLVDDFIGQGGTLANLKGYIESNGGHVIGATVLTGKDFSAKLKPDAEKIAALRKKHGNSLEAWWIGRFGYSFDLLTQSEARYLERSPDADTIRSRIVAAEQARNC